MIVEAASIEQIRQAEDGGWIIIPAEAGTVAGDLARLDKGLRLRLSVGGECFCVYHEWHDGCPHNGTGGPGSTYLVRSVPAHRNSFGVWEGADQRLIDRLEYVNPAGRGGYDYAAELEKSHHEAQKRSRDEFAERVGEHAEQVAHELRKADGSRYRGRAFINKPEVS